MARPELKRRGAASLRLDHAFDACARRIIRAGIRHVPAIHAVRIAVAVSSFFFADFTERDMWILLERHPADVEPADFRGFDLTFYLHTCAASDELPARATASTTGASDRCRLEIQGFRFGEFVHYSSSSGMNPPACAWMPGCSSSSRSSSSCSRASGSMCASCRSSESCIPPA